LIKFFSHFLSPQVFSEKMGLEAGWNCHISLLNDPGGGANSESGGVASGQGSFVQGQRSADSSQSQENLPGVVVAEAARELKDLRLLVEDSLASRSQSAPCMMTADDSDDEQQVMGWKFGYPGRL
jgi:hypothetical protein